MGAAGGCQHCHGPLLTSHSHINRLPMEKTLLPEKPLPLGTKGKIPQTSEPPQTPRSSLTAADGHSDSLTQPCAPSSSSSGHPQQQPGPAPALPCWPGHSLGAQGGGSPWKMRLLLRNGTININRLTRCFDEAPLKLVHHEGPWEHSGR